MSITQETRPLHDTPAQVVSRARVSDYGEVYTAPREVNAMLDLVKQETERIESRFLEPACGTGNFLIEILRRKLAVVESRYSKVQTEYERYTIIAVSSLYGIDILEDNVIECRKRLADIIMQNDTRLFGACKRDDFFRTIAYILEKNIISGDALSLQSVGASPVPIIFSEWSFFNGNMVKRRDFSFATLLQTADTHSLPLFSDAGEDVFIPKPVKEFCPVHYLKIWNIESANERELTRMEQQNE